MKDCSPSSKTADTSTIALACSAGIAFLLVGRTSRPFAKIFGRKSHLNLQNSHRRFGRCLSGSARCSIQSKASLPSLE